MSFLADPYRFRKTVAGVALIGAPLAGLLSCLSDSNEGVGEQGATLYATVAAHRSGILATGLVFMLSAVLTVPAALAFAHLLRGRGSVLGHLGAASLMLGAFGHFGYGLWQVLIAQAAGAGDPAPVVAFADRTAGVSQAVLLPLMILVDVGILLLSAGLLRARAVPAWAPWLTIAAVAVDFGVQFTPVTATWPVTGLWGLLTVVFGYYGLRVLAMPVSRWAGSVPAPVDAQRVPVPA